MKVRVHSFAWSGFSRLVHNHFLSPRRLPLRHPPLLHIQRVGRFQLLRPRWRWRDILPGVLQPVLPGREGEAVDAELLEHHQLGEAVVARIIPIDQHRLGENEARELCEARPAAGVGGLAVSHVRVDDRQIPGLARQLRELGALALHVWRDVAEHRVGVEPLRGLGQQVGGLADGACWWGDPAVAPCQRACLRTESARWPALPSWWALTSSASQLLSYALQFLPCGRVARRFCATTYVFVRAGSTTDARDRGALSVLAMSVWYLVEVRAIRI